MRYTLQSATQKVEAKGVQLYTEKGKKIVNTSKAKNIGIKTLGVIDYLIKIHGYRRVK